MRKKMGNGEIDSCLRLSERLREEQIRLISDTLNFDTIPSNNIRRQIAELELNIAAVENYIIELKER